MEKNYNEFVKLYYCSIVSVSVKVECFGTFYCVLSRSRTFLTIPDRSRRSIKAGVPFLILSKRL